MNIGDAVQQQLEEVRAAVRRLDGTSVRLLEARQAAAEAQLEFEKALRKLAELAVEEGIAFASKEKVK